MKTSTVLQAQQRGNTTQREPLLAFKSHSTSTHDNQDAQARKVRRRVMDDDVHQGKRKQGKQGQPRTAKDMHQDSQERAGARSLHGQQLESQKPARQRRCHMNQHPKIRTISETATIQKTALHRIQPPRARPDHIRSILPPTTKHRPQSPPPTTCPKHSKQNHAS